MEETVFFEANEPEGGEECIACSAEAEQRRYASLQTAITALELGHFPGENIMTDGSTYQAPTPEEFIRYAKVFEAFLKGE